MPPVGRGGRLASANLRGMPSSHTSVEQSGGLRNLDSVTGTPQSNMSSAVNMPPVGRSGRSANSRRIPSNPTSTEQSEALRNSEPIAETPQTNMSSAGSTSLKTGRGVTRGKELERINRTNGKRLLICIDEEKGRPTDPIQSSKLSSELGIVAREFLPVPTKWRDLSEIDITPAYDRLDMRLDIANLEEESIKKKCELILKNCSRQERYRLHKQFIKFGATKKPSKLTQENWDELCRYWSDPKVQARCEINKENRSKLTITHNQGSRAFVAARHEISVKKNNGVERDRIEFFWDSHFSAEDGWTTTTAEAKYNEMKDLQSQPTPEGETPMTVDEIADQVLGKKSGYVKGLGCGPKPTIVSSSQVRLAQLEDALRKSQEDARKSQEDARKSQEESSELRRQLASQMESVVARQAEYDRILATLLGSNHHSLNNLP